MNAEGLPKAFDHKLEPNTKLAKFKEVRSGKWSLRSVKSRRLEEAAEIAEFVAQNVSFQGNYKIWSPGAGAIGVGARACRMLGDESRRKRTFEPVRVAPPNIINEVICRRRRQADRTTCSCSRQKPSWRP
jgi:hypothetical protein